MKTLWDSLFFYLLIGQNVICFFDLQPSFKYVAVEETILFVLNRTDFMKAFAENPDILSEMRDNLKKKFEIHEKSFEEVNETRTSENWKSSWQKII